MDQNNDIKDLHVEHTFPVSVEKLYAAWTEEDQLVQWWKPMETTLQSAKSIPEKDGEITYTFDNADFSITGKYESVEPSASLKYSWNWAFDSDVLKNENFVLDVRFTAQDDHSSKISVTQQGFKNKEEHDAHEAGWKIGFEQLEQFLKK